MPSPTKAQREARKAAGLCLYCGEEPPVELPDGRILTYGEKCRAKNHEAHKRHEGKKKAEASAAAGLNGPVPGLGISPAPPTDEPTEPVTLTESALPLYAGKRSRGECVAAGCGCPAVIKTDGTSASRCDEHQAMARRYDKERRERKKSDALAAAGLNSPLPPPAADEAGGSAKATRSRSKGEAFATKKAVALSEGKCTNCFTRPQATSVRPGRKGEKIQLCAECRNKARAVKGLEPIPVQDPVIGDKQPAVKEVVAQSTTGRLNIKQLLIEQFGPKCFGCGASAVLPNGGIDEHFLTVDHIYPKKRPNGMPGNDELYNSGLLCDPCNRIKNNKLTVEQLRAHNASKNRLRVPYDELQDMLAVLDWAVKIHESRAADLAYQSLADFARAKRGIDGGG